MRYDTPIYVQSRVPGAYNAETGDYENDVITEKLMYADVTESGLKTVQIVYGKLNKDSKTVRIQGRCPDACTRIRIGSTLYGIDRRRKLHNKEVLVVSEVSV